jgi:hypothetical protein
VVDGSTMDVPDSQADRDAFDGPCNADGPGACPQVRLVAHAECGTKALLDATFDGYRVAETTLAARLLGSLGPGMLVMADRNFLSWRLWRDAAATGAHLLWRASDSFTLPVLERLSDGSYRSALRPPRKRDGPPIAVRLRGQPPRHQTTLPPLPRPRRPTRQPPSNPHHHPAPRQVPTSQDHLRKQHWVPGRVRRTTNWHPNKNYRVGDESDSVR